MPLQAHAEGVVLLALIVGMLVIGFGLTLRSGVVNSTSSQGLRQLAANFSQTILIVSGCLIVLALIQQLVGQRLGLLW